MSMLSVVIPTSNSERVLVPTLAMLVPGAMSGFVREVLIADAGSTDETLEVVDIAGCTVLSSSLSLAARLRAAAAAARSPWLMFLRAGAVLDTTWIDETARFIDESDRSDGSAAVFRKAISARASYPALREIVGLLMFSVFGRMSPDQGLVISRRLYDGLGGHRDAAADSEADLLARLGRRVLMLRSGARSS
jgi:glycosyltransferase involved in cell wall biosynthesis